MKIFFRFILLLITFAVLSVGLYVCFSVAAGYLSPSYLNYLDYFLLASLLVVLVVGSFLLKANDSSQHQSTTETEFRRHTYVKR